MLRIATSFQDAPGDGYYFILFFEGRPLREQLEQLGLKDGDSVMLYDDDCTFETEAVLLFDYLYPMMPERTLWARAVSNNE